MGFRLSDRYGDCIGVDISPKDQGVLVTVQEYDGNRITGDAQVSLTALQAVRLATALMQFAFPELAINTKEAAGE